MTKRRRERWAPPPYNVDDIRAVQALATYATLAEIPSSDEVVPPSPSEVKRALDWIINTACGTYDEPFIQGEPDATSYLLGRRSAGLAIVKAMKLKPDVISEN